MYYVDEDQLLAMWRFEEKMPFGGWMLEHLDGRWEGEPLTWDYKEEVLARLKQSDMLLDLDTGDGGFLLDLRHPYERTCATERSDADYEYCVEQLAPLGVRMAYCNADEEELPFADNMFNVVLCRHGGYKISELRRVLKPGGLFITEQIGELDNRDLALRLLPNCPMPFPGHNLNNAARAFASFGFNILHGQEDFPRLLFRDVGAIVYFARTVDWEFPGFSVDRCRDELMMMHYGICRNGFVESEQHRFLMIAQKAAD